MSNYEQIEVIRAKAGLSKQEMADALGVSPRSYSIWRDNDPDEKYLITAKYLFGGSEAKPDLLLSAIYEQKREALLTAYINADETVKEQYSESYIFAYYKRLCPYFELDDPEEDPFKLVYDVSYALIYDLLGFIDEYLECSSLNYYDLEFKFHGESRHKIMNCLEYFVVNNRLSKRFIKGLLSYAPSELSALKDFCFRKDDIIIDGK